MKKHLLGGVSKGAFTQEAAEAKFAQWLEQKAGKISAKESKLSSDKAAAVKARLEEEKKVKEAKEKALEAKRAEAAAAPGRRPRPRLLPRKPLRRRRPLLRRSPPPRLSPTRGHVGKCQHSRRPRVEVFRLGRGVAGKPVRYVSRPILI